MKKLLVAAILLACTVAAFAQSERDKSENERSFSFAYLSDIHIALGAKSVEDAQACIDDINRNPQLKFSIFAGDITENKFTLKYN
ncbi:MAG: hypothetical protein IKD16_02350 [Bacteroidales bacterium]|nr:hypothetical protein [Bacteroidales bacterium]